MWNSKNSAKLSIAVCFVLAAALLLFIVAGHWIFEFYMTAYRGFTPDGDAIKMLKTVFAFCFYPSSIFAGAIIYVLLRLLFNIKNDKVFIDRNVTYLRVVSWCCFVIAIITFAGGFFYMPFMFIALGGGFVGMLLWVLKNVMQSAVSLREENDLTI